MRTKIIVDALRHCATHDYCNDECPAYDRGVCDQYNGIMLAAAARLKELLKQANERPVDLDIKYFTDIPEIEKTEKGDWIDLRAAKDVELKAGEEAVIPLGVGMILPPGYEAWILPRSSTPRKFGIMCANSMGIIDNSYNGENDEWGFVAVALRDTTIHKGDRICQFRIMKNMPELNIYTANHLNPVSRGGFGSTGTK